MRSGEYAGPARKGSFSHTLNLLPTKGRGVAMRRVRDAALAEHPSVKPVLERITEWDKFGETMAAELVAATGDWLNTQLTDRERDALERSCYGLRDGEE